MVAVLVEQFFPDSYRKYVRKKKPRSTVYLNVNKKITSILANF